MAIPASNGNYSYYLTPAVEPYTPAINSPNTIAATVVDTAVNGYVPGANPYLNPVAASTATPAVTAAIVFPISTLTNQFTGKAY